MADRDNVINHFQDAIEAGGNGNKWRFVRVDIIEDALELLKELEPVKPILAYIGKYPAINGYRCPVCKTDLYHLQKYCDECGRAVKWDD